MNHCGHCPENGPYITVGLEHEMRIDEVHHADAEPKFRQFLQNSMKFWKMRIKLDLARTVKDRVIRILELIREPFEVFR